MRTMHDRLQGFKQFIALLFLGFCTVAGGEMAAPLTAYAQWPADGLQFCQGDSCAGVYNTFMHRDGTGGALLLWDRNYQNYGVAAQRVGGSGKIATGWPINGRSVSGVPQVQAYESSCPDGAGGTFIVWTDLRPTVDIFAQHFGPDSRPVPGWPVDGIRICAAAGSQRTWLSACLNDGAGGFFAMWEDTRNFSATSRDIYGHHIRADGTPFPGWPAEGLAVCVALRTQQDPIMSGDGSGGIFVVWDDLRGGVYLQHMLADGTLASGFPADGRLLVGPTTPRIGTVTLAPPQPDGSGGFFLLCGKEIAGTGEFDYYILRVQADGSISPGWLPGGLPVPVTVGLPGTHFNATHAADGVGGVFVSWNDTRDYAASAADHYVQHFLGDGSRAPGCPPNGVMVAGGPNFQTGNLITGDGMGGLYLIYDDYNDFIRVHAQHIGPNGLPSPGWPVGGRLVAGASSVQQRSRAICTDDAGGAYVALETSDGLGYLQRLVPDGIVATLASLIRCSVTSERAVLVWSAPALPSTFMVERRRSDSVDWSVLGEASFLPGDQLEYQDNSIEPGSSYYYRLRYSANGALITSAEAWVTVPTIAAFALAGAVPNPARASDLRVRFSLPGAEPARVSMIDLNGRRVIDQVIAGGVMGVRDVALRTGIAVRPGLYWLVLEHGARRATTKVTVME